MNLGDWIFCFWRVWLWVWKEVIFGCVQAWCVQILEDFGAEKRHGRLQGGDEDGGLLGGLS